MVLFTYKLDLLMSDDPSNGVTAARIDAKLMTIGIYPWK